MDQPVSQEDEKGGVYSQNGVGRSKKESEEYLDKDFYEMRKGMVWDGMMNGMDGVLVEWCRGFGLFSFFVP